MPKFHQPTLQGLRGLGSIIPKAALLSDQTDRKKRALARAMKDLADVGLIRRFKFDGRLHYAPNSRRRDAVFAAVFAIQTTRRDPESNCMPWTGRVDPREGPLLNFAGVRYSVRRLIYRRYTSKKLGTHESVRMRCGNESCIQFHHMTKEARNESQKGVRRSLEARKRMAQVQRQKSSTKLTLEKVQAMRIRCAAGELSQAKAAKILGISTASMSRIMRGLAWRDYSSPYVCL